MKLAHQVQRNLLQLFNQNPASMAIRRISDNMMLNANNSFRIIWLFFKEEVIGKQPRIKAIYGTGKYRVDHIINQSNEVIKDFEVNVEGR
jgi:hypothetical protein